MLGVLVVPVHEADKIRLIKRLNVKALIRVQRLDKFGVLYNDHPLRPTIVNEVGCQTNLISLVELILSVCTELTVVWRIQKYKIVGFRRMPLQKFLEIEILDRCLPQKILKYVRL